MKLRIRGNSIRLRLTRSEVERFGAEGAVEETLELGPGQDVLRYALRKGGGSGIRAEYSGGSLDVIVPAEQADDWAGTEQVGMEAVTDIGGGRQLKLLIEKDFVCLSEREGEDDSDAFPNPAAAGA